MAKRILLCGDAERTLKGVRDILAGGGYKIAGEVGDGQQAAEQYARLAPDLVLLDIAMPDGVQVLRQIKQSDGEARVIICAGLGQGNLVMEAMKNGAADFIVKPFLSGRLLTMVERCLS